MAFIPNLNVLNNLNSAGINPRITAFRGTGLYSGITEPRKDSFSTNPLYDNFVSKAEIEALAKSNSRIMSLLKEHKIPLKPNIEVLEELKKGHLADARIIAAKIYSALPPDLKSQVNLSDLQQAAVLHDFGKVLIPKDILNKAGVLTHEEKEIMDLHSELGYELLKQKGVKPEVLNLIKYHHQNPHGTGYPAADRNFEYGIPSQILAASDKYSALTEKRPYHEPLPKDAALEIIKKDVDSGDISQEIFDALYKTV